MRFAIAYYEGNVAGKNIVDRFRDLGFNPQVPIIALEKDTIYSEGINVENYPELKEIDFLFFASTHKSKKGDPSLCLHVAGNWRGADLGGKDSKVCLTSAFVMKYLFQKLDENAKKEDIYNKYKISMEATHHGPLVDIPSCFIELGSLDKEWRDVRAARVIADTILCLGDVEFSDLNKRGWEAVICIGGGHYCLNFNRIQLKSNYAIGHVIPDYGFPVSEGIVKEAESKTKEKIVKVLIDWKSCGKSEERKKVLDVLDKLGLKYKRTSKILLT
jgi:D-aminoacyl-tRNA deacylase